MDLIPDRRGRATASAAPLEGIEVNHACAPNVEAVERYSENDELEIAVCAIRRICAGEELFLDYTLVIDGDDAADYPCVCGTWE